MTNIEFDPLPRRSDGRDRGSTFDLSRRVSVRESRPTRYRVPTLLAASYSTVDYRPSRMVYTIHGTALHATLFTALHATLLALPSKQYALMILIAPPFSS